MSTPGPDPLQHGRGLRRPGRRLDQPPRALRQAEHQTSMMRGGGGRQPIALARRTDSEGADDGGDHDADADARSGSRAPGGPGTSVGPVRRRTSERSASRHRRRTRERADPATAAPESGARTHSAPTTKRTRKITRVPLRPQLVRQVAAGQCADDRAEQDAGGDDLLPSVGDVEVVGDLQERPEMMPVS